MNLQFTRIPSSENRPGALMSESPPRLKRYLSAIMLTVMFSGHRDRSTASSMASADATYPFPMSPVMFPSASMTLKYISGCSLLMALTTSMVLSPIMPDTHDVTTKKFLCPSSIRSRILCSRDPAPPKTDTVSSISVERILADCRSVLSPLLISAMLFSADIMCAQLLGPCTMVTASETEMHP